MCVYSMILDTYGDKWKEKDWMKPVPGYPGGIGVPYPRQPSDASPPYVVTTPPPITREEFDELKRDIEMLKRLIPAAIKYDQDNNEPNCELEEKKELVRRLAELVGVKIDL